MNNSEFNLTQEQELQLQLQRQRLDSTTKALYFYKKT